MRSADTTAEAHALQLEVYRSLSPVERLELAMTMSYDVMAMTVAGSLWPALGAMRVDPVSATRAE